MKVKELIAFLSNLDPEMEVIKPSENFEMNYANVKARYPMPIKMSPILETFRDAFDGEEYRSEVWKMDDQGQEVILL